MSKKIEIRNSMAEFLFFQIEGKESDVQVWCTTMKWCGARRRLWRSCLNVPLIISDCI